MNDLTLSIILLGLAALYSAAAACDCYRRGSRAAAGLWLVVCIGMLIPMLTIISKLIY